MRKQFSVKYAEGDERWISSHADSWEREAADPIRKTEKRIS